MQIFLSPDSPCLNRQMELTTVEMNKTMLVVVVMVMTVMLIMMLLVVMMAAVAVVVIIMLMVMHKQMELTQKILHIKGCMV